MRLHLLTNLPEQPVAQKGEWPKIVMDGLCRAQGRVGTPQRGNPPRMYTLLRYRNDLEHVCRKAETPFPLTTDPNPNPNPNPYPNPYPEP